MINPINYAEVAGRFARIEDLEDALPLAYYERRPLPWEAAFLAGQCFVKYRRRGGTRPSPLPEDYSDDLPVKLRLKPPSELAGGRGRLRRGGRVFRPGVPPGV